MTSASYAGGIAGSAGKASIMMMLYHDEAVNDDEAVTYINDEAVTYINDEAVMMLYRIPWHVQCNQ